MEKLTRMCKMVWKELSTEEKEAYHYDTGMIGFISNMARVLHKDVSTITSEDFATLGNELSWL